VKICQGDKAAKLKKCNNLIENKSLSGMQSSKLFVRWASLSYGNEKKNLSLNFRRQFNFSGYRC
jgi:hypothetical protein